MAVVAPANPRATTTETSSGLEIVVPAKKNWLITLFLGLWLCGWAVGVVVVVTHFLSADMPSEVFKFAAVWLVAWMLGGAFALLVFCWSLAGKERIVLSSDRIALKHEIFGWGRTREYELVHVRSLRAAQSPYNPADLRSGFRLLGIGGGSIAFDHGSKTIRFAAGLDEAEAQSLVARLVDRGNIADFAT
jgi:hypothetical protein